MLDEPISRRRALQLGALAAGAPALAALPLGATAAGSPEGGDPGPKEVVEATIVQLQAAMASGRLSSRSLVDLYLERIEAIDRRGPRVNSIIQVNPDARHIAAELDEERRRSGPRGPLHGIPLVVKDNIDTHDAMLTTAGSLALTHSIPAHDATVAERLRRAGAVLLAKANLSEWANFRSNFSSSGWSGRGGQVSNPYALDRSPCGSSSGSAAAVSANLAAAALGTETDGSIVCPSGLCGIVGIKPTLGLTSRAGVIPIAHSQDVVGPMGRTVADAAAVLGALVGVDPRDPATAASAGHLHTDYTKFLDRDGLRGARIGIARSVYFGYQDKVDAIANAGIEAMRKAGATIVDPADIPTAKQMAASSDELTVLLYEFKQDLNAYLAARHDPQIHTLADLIAFNSAHAATELQYFGQDLFLQAEAVDLVAERAAYLAALANDQALSRQQGIDAALAAHNLDALYAPTGSVPWKIDLLDGDHFLGSSSQPAALAGYPAVVVPAGFSFGLPVGVSFFGTAWSEPTLIRIASGFEAVTRARRPPRFIPPQVII